MVPQPYLAHSPTNYQQPTYEPYWTPDPNHTTATYPEAASTNGTTPQYDFTTFSADLFQPEEIFQLDQPLRPDYMVQQNDAARSPPTLLDLGSGTIHREFKNEEYWIQNQSQISNIVNDDSNNSSCSRMYLNQSPDSRDISLNNNVTSVEIEKLHFNLETKINDLSQNCKYPSKNGTENSYYNNCVQVEPDYRSQQSFSDIISDTRIFYGQDEHNLQNYTENFNSDFKNVNYRYPVDVRVQEKNELVDLDLPAYVDYSNVSYESKITLNDSMEVINEIDYRMQCNNILVTNTHYPTDTQYENINILTNN